MSYQDELQAALNKLRELESVRSAVDKQIRGYTAIVESFQQLIAQECFEERSSPLDLEPVGFTDAVRMILKHHVVSMSPLEIRDSLVAGGVTGSSEKNLLINVHTVVRRLVEAGEVQEAERKGERVFQWVTGLRRALMDLEPKPVVDSKHRTSHRNSDRATTKVGAGRKA